MLYYTLEDAHCIYVSVCKGVLIACYVLIGIKYHIWNNCMSDYTLKNKEMRLETPHTFVVLDKYIYIYI